MKRLPDSPQRGTPITIDFEGDSLPALDGEPVACSLLAAGERVFARSIKYHRARGPYCLSAACSHCLMRVDGVPNVYTCRTPARAGMRLERQNAYPSVKVDIFESIDWLFPRGLDHHAMFAGVPVAEKVMAKVARHLAGLGLLPDKEAPERMPCEVLRTRVAIAGGGAAGSAAAAVFAAKGTPFVLCEREDFLGGRLATGAPSGSDPAPPANDALPKEAVRLRASIIGLYDDEDGRYFAVTQLDEADQPRLLKVYAERFLICVGGHPQLYPFGNNDLPGVFAGRAASLLIRRQGLLPGEEVAVVGTGDELYDLAKLLEGSGAKLAAVVDTEGPPPASAPRGAVQGSDLEAHGRTKVNALSFRKANGRKTKVDCDAIAVSLPPSPSYELARQGGARISYRPDHRIFAVEADEGGQTHAVDVRVAGDVTGVMSASQAVASGRRAAEALVRGLP